MATKNVSTQYKMPGMTRKNRKNGNVASRKNRKNGEVSRKNRKMNNRKNGNAVVMGGKRRATRKSRKARKGSRRAGRR